MEIDIEELTLKNKRENILMMLKHTEDRANRIIDEKKQQLAKYKARVEDAKAKVAEPAQAQNTE
jgi:hypothetical protein